MGRKIKIFVADDNEQIRLITQSRWAIRGVEATCFASGKELLNGLRAAINDLPVAVMTDFVMEGGYEGLISQLKQEFPEVPIIAYTGLDHQGSIQSFSLGAYAVMQRPLDFNELYGILEELAGQEELFVRLAQDARTLTDTQNCLVWQYSKSKKAYHIVGWSGSIDYPTRKSLMSEQDFPRVAQMAKDGQLVFLPDVMEADIYKQSNLAKNWKWKSLLAIPLLRNERLIGWIDCYTTEKKHFITDLDTWLKERPYLQQFANQATEALHSTVLAQHFRILHETNQILAGTFDYKTIYDTILTKAKEVTGADCGWIYEYHSSEQVLKLGDCYGIGSDLLAPIRPMKKGGITGAVASTGSSLNVPDVTKASDGYKPSIFIPVSGLKTSSVLSIVMRKRDTTLGVITLKSTEESFFTQEDSQLITALAAVGAISMERTKLTHHLSEISKMAQGTTNFEELAQYVVNAVRDLTEADVNLWMSSPREGEGNEWMRIVRSSKSAKDKAYHKYIREAKVPIAPGKSLIAEALHNNKAVIVSDLFKHEDNPPFHNKEAIEKFEWHSFMTIPLIGKNEEHLGAISLFSKIINKFTDDDAILIRHFADQAALALQKQRHIAVMEELTQMSQELTTGLPASKKLSKKVAELAKKISKAEFAVVYPLERDDNDRYSKDLYATAGTLRVEKMPREQPRINGMAAYIRDHGMLIVENIEPKAIKVKVGVGSKTYLNQEHPDFDRINGFIRDSKIIARENIQAFVGIPLKAAQKGSDARPQEHNIAVLYANFRAPHHFSEEDLQVLNIFAAQVANIIYRNLLYERNNRQREVLNSLTDSALHILEAEQTGNPLDKIVQEAVKVLDARGGKVYLLVNGSQKDLKLVAARNLPKHVMKVGELLPKGVGMAQQVVASSESKIVNDYKNYEHAVPEYKEFFSSVIEVPLKFGNEVIGVLGVFDDNETRRFNERDVTILNRLAGLAALAIHNNQLYNEINAFSNTSTQIVKQASMKDMAKIILKELRNIIPYDRASFQRIESPFEHRIILAMEGYKEDKINERLLTPLSDDKLIYPHFKKKEIFILSDTSQHYLWDPNIQETKDIGSWICIPLVYNDSVVGLILLDHLIKGYYGEKDRAKIARFANFAAIALNNTLVDQQHMTVLQEFANRITKITDEDSVDNIFTESVEIIKDIFKPKHFVFHYSDEDYFIKRKYLLDLLPKNFHPRKLDMNKKGVGQHGNLASWVAQEADSRQFPDDFDKAMFPNTQLHEGYNLTFAPVWRQSKIVGVLEILAKESEHDENRKSFLSTLILQAGMAVQNIEQREQRVEAILAGFNPYVVGRPIKNVENFYGRKTILRKLVAGIHNNHFIIIDDWRIGKTSLLFRFEKEIVKLTTQNQGFFPAYLMLQGEKPEKFFALLMNKIRQAFNFSFLEIDDFSQYSYDDFRDDIREIKNEVREKYGEDYLALAIILMDEVDEFNNYPIDTLKSLRALLVEEDILRVVMVGSKVKFIEIDTSPWHNVQKPEKLGPFTEEEAEELITKPVEGKYIFHPEAITEIIKRSHLLPLQIQYYCYEAVQNMLNRKGNVVNSKIYISLDDVKNIPDYKPIKHQTDFSI